VRVEGVCGDSSFKKEYPANFVSLGKVIDVINPKLWWPLGYGEQPLYDVKVTLLHHGEIADVYTCRIGIRKLILDTKWEAGDAGEFKIVCNGTPILAKGSNWVPMDALHSRDHDRVQAAIDLFVDAGCNIVRCWGGNVYEDHNFFDLCDEHGIMVWQDFAMACAVYPPSAEFIAAITKEATAVVRKLRNHPSLLLWAGDNEIDEGLTEKEYPTYSNRYNAISREVLPRVIRMEDPNRVYLYSSPYIPEGIARYDVPEQHNWGARAYFKDDFYKHTKAHFISECGYHGCPAPSSLKKFIPEDKLTPWLNNSVWDTHGSDYLLRAEKDFIPALRSQSREPISIFKNGTMVGYLSLARSSGALEEFAIGNEDEVNAFRALAKELAKPVTVRLSGYDVKTLARVKDACTVKQSEPAQFRIINAEPLKAGARALGLDENVIYAPYLT